MTETTDWRGRLRNAVRSKWGHVAWSLIGLPMACLIASTTSFTLVHVVGVFGPSFVVSLLQLVCAYREQPCPFDAKVNEEASRLIRDNVVAAVILLFLVGAAIQAFGEGIDGLLAKQDSTLRALIVLYPWLGLIRAMLATHWTKKSVEKNAAPVVGAVEVDAWASTSHESVLVDGLEGCYNTAAGDDGGRSSERRTSAAEEFSVNSARDRRLMVAGVVIGVLSRRLIARRLRRN